MTTATGPLTRDDLGPHGLGYCIFGDCDKPATVVLQEPASEHRTVRSEAAVCLADAHTIRTPGDEAAWRPMSPPDDSLAESAAREWSPIAGEALTVENIGGCLYAFGSELACLRLEHKWNVPHARARYSEPRASWFFCLEPHW